MRAPTLKTLEQNFPSVAPDKLRLARAVLKGLVSPETVPETADWVRSCFNKPRASELVRHALNALLDCHGVEQICRGSELLAEYLNTGDSYSPTLLFRAGHCWVGTWGGFVESYERRHGRVL